MGAHLLHAHSSDLQVIPSEEISLLPCIDRGCQLKNSENSFFQIVQLKNFIAVSNYKKKGARRIDVNVQINNFFKHICVICAAFYRFFYFLLLSLFFYYY